MEEVVLVDTNDVELGLMEKLQAHKEGRLHRAFSVFLFNKNNELLLQQRAFGKYHCGGLWTNTCCSHPRHNEDILAAANRRLQEEMGISSTLEHAYSFIYKADVGNGLVEHELDHVFTGYFDGVPNLNEDEVVAFKYMSLAELGTDVAENAADYTPWFRIILADFLSKKTDEVSL